LRYYISSGRKWAKRMLVADRGIIVGFKAVFVMVSG
jgi:hypothetical protein